jgi:hypothetical protein
MGKFFKRLLDLIGLPGDIQTLINILGLSGMIAAVNGYLAHAAREDWYLLILVALGTFAICMFIFNQAQIAYRKNAIFQGIAIGNLVPAHIGTKLSDNGDLSLGTMFNIHNNSDRIIYLKAKRVDLVIQNKTNKPQKVEVVVLVHPKTNALLNVKNIEGIDTNKNIEGYLETEILYGGKPDDLRYNMTYEASVLVQVEKFGDPEKKNEIAKLVILPNIKKVEHEKLRTF